VGPTRGNDIVINHHLPQKSKCMQNDKFNRYGSFGNHDFKNKYDSVFAFFKNKSYFIQLFLILSHKVKPQNSRTK
jgi:hypothetical protein